MPDRSFHRRRDKWIVFVDNKNDGLNLYDSLSKNFSVAYIDRMTSLPDDGVKKAIINDEYFKQSVLITTPVIDSGVNICDDNVKNIVIFYTDRTQFIQSLGRKRLKEDESGVNVWAFVPNKMSFSARAKYYEQDELTGIRLLFAVGIRYHYFNSELSKNTYSLSMANQDVICQGFFLHLKYIFEIKWLNSFLLLCCKRVKARWIAHPSRRTYVCRMQYHRPLGGGE